MYNFYMDDLSLQVSMSELRDNLAAYLDLVEHGKTITITRHGKPSAELRTAERATPIDLEALEAFRASLGVEVEESIIIKMRQGERY